MISEFYIHSSFYLDSFQDMAQLRAHASAQSYILFAFTRSQTAQGCEKHKTCQKNKGTE